MVGVQLQKLANNHQGHNMMTGVRQRLATHFGDECRIVMDDMSSIRLKLRWEGSQFTVTLTPNTAYITVQGPSAQTLLLAQHIQEVVGGTVYAAKEPGKAPSNPHEATQAATEHSAAEVRAEHSATEAATDRISSEVTQPATDHGAAEATTTHSATEATQPATIHGAAEPEPEFAGTAPSAAGGTVSASVSGNENIQVGTVVINEQPTQDIRAMSALIQGMINLLCSNRGS